MKLSHTQWGTIVMMAATAVVLIFADIALATNHELGDTISAIIIEASLRCAFIPYAFGCIAGHLFHKVQRPVIAQPWFYPFGIMPGLGILLWAAASALDVTQFGNWVPLVPLGFGVVAGATLWDNYGFEGE